MLRCDAAPRRGLGHREVAARIASAAKPLELHRALHPSARDTAAASCRPRASRRPRRSASSPVPAGSPSIHASSRVAPSRAATMCARSRSARVGSPGDAEPDRHDPRPRDRARPRCTAGPRLPARRARCAVTSGSTSTFSNVSGTQPCSPSRRHSDGWAKRAHARPSRARRATSRSARASATSSSVTSPAKPSPNASLIGQPSPTKAATPPATSIARRSRSGKTLRAARAIRHISRAVRPSRRRARFSSAWTILEVQRAACTYRSRARQLAPSFRSAART